MAQAKSPEVKAKIIAAWHEAQANGETRKSFHERIKGTELEITYGGLERWLNPKKGSVGNTTSHTPANAELPSLVTAATLDDVEAAYKKSIQTLITSLEQQEHELNRELFRVKNDLIKAREKLTKFD